MRIVSGFKRDYSSRIAVIVDVDLYAAFKAAEAIAGPDYYLHASGPIDCAVPAAAINRPFTSEAELFAAVPGLLRPVA